MTLAKSLRHLCRTHQHLSLPPNSGLAWHAAAGHASGIVCLDIAPDGQWVVAVGLDGHSRQLMVLWRLGDLAQEGQVRLARLTMGYVSACVCCAAPAGDGAEDACLHVL